MLAAELLLGAAALAAGLTGTWSPCGFSMVETLGRGAARPRAVVAACVTFAAGTVLGGAATFGTLAAAGRIVHSGGAAALAVGAAIAVAAAIAEARGVRIVPQIRRQVPEPWRRRVPLPLAAAGYGFLLGLGFTTFVLTYGVWALAAISFALGDVRAGLVVGVAFGVGRAVPVVAIAPVAARPLGARLLEAMAERPGILRGFRVADAVLLAAVGLGLATTQASAAVTVVARGATDPSAGGGRVAWNGRAAGFLSNPAEAPPGPHHLSGIATELPGRDPALGGPFLALRAGDAVSLLRVPDLEPVTEVQVPGASGLAVSSRWLVYRVRRPSGDRIAARPLADPSREVPVAVALAPAQLGRPSVDGDVVVFHVATRRSSRIVAHDLSRSTSTVLRSSRVAALTNPSLVAGRVLYVRQSNTTQQLQLGPARPAARDRTLLRAASTSVRDSGFEPGHSRVTLTPPAGVPARTSFWTTALAPRAAYVTLLPRAAGVRGATIVRVPR